LIVIDRAQLTGRWRVGRESLASTERVAASATCVRVAGLARTFPFVPVDSPTESAHDLRAIDSRILRKGFVLARQRRLTLESCRAMLLVLQLGLKPHAFHGSKELGAASNRRCETEGTTQSHALDSDTEAPRFSSVAGERDCPVPSKPLAATRCAEARLA
jgi:hypothetical protein